MIVDTNPVCAYASTRNQGWLHSGAFYAIHGDIVVAQACRSGYHYIEHFYPDTIHEQTRCYFLFKSQRERQDAIKRCNTANIPAFPVDIRSVQEREPILRGSRFTYPLEVLDRPIDSSQLLQQVAREACTNGARFHKVASLDSIKPTWNTSNEHWQIATDGGLEIECKVIVVACGTYIPAMLGRMISGQVPNFTIMKVPVLVLHGEVAHSMLITPKEWQGPNLVPFYGIEGGGATVSLMGIDEIIADHRDARIPDDCTKRHAASLSDAYVGMKTIISQGVSITAHFYTCQKLFLHDESTTNYSSRTYILLAHAPQLGAPESIYTLYPGKFTVAPVASQQCVERIVRYLGASRASRVPRRLDAFTIARQPYFDPSEYKLVVDNNGALRFHPLQELQQS
jgi:FAD dependent oxidoreductase